MRREERTALGQISGRTRRALASLFKSSVSPASHYEYEMVAADDREAVDKDDLEGTSANEPELATVPPVGTNALVGVAKVEAVQAVYGKYGKYCLWAGLAMMMIVFELDNSTVYTYQNYATSAFDQLALLSTLSTAQTIVTAVVKPPIAKISDVLGRGETYLFTISCYLISYALCASAPTISAYAAGAIFYSIGQSGTQILDQIIISDISTARWRGLVLGLSYFPFLITPWVAAFIVDSVTRQGGIGWRWGIGMFAIIMPFASSFIIITLLYLQRKARKSGLVLTTRLTVYDFCSLIDLGGLFLLCSGAAMFLLPLTLAAQTPSAWRTPWVGTVIALGVLSLAALVPYEKYVARHPVVPVRYGRNRSIVMSCVLAAVDTAGFSATHVYLYSWSVVAHNYSARNATFLVYTNGVTQCLTGIVAGALMYRYRRYKPLAVAGALVRLVGYALMLRLRGTTNPASELFLVQLVQGVGSGFVQQVAVVAGQVAVPHEELAGVSALVLLSTFMGSAVGSCIAGGIYTGVFKDALRRRLGKVPGAEVDEATVERLISSITGTALPAWGSAERVALDFAFSDVMRDISIAALAIAVPVLVAAWFLPNLRLPEGAVYSVFEGQSADKAEERGRDVRESPSPTEEESAEKRRGSS